MVEGFIYSVEEPICELCVLLREVGKLLVDVLARLGQVGAMESSV